MKSGRKKIKMTSRTKKVRKLNVKARPMTMRDDPFEKMTLQELRELQASIDRHIGQRQAEERSALREKFRRMAEEQGFALADIVGTSRGGKGRTVAAKYVNPDNPLETWSGRGRQPRWMVARLKSGAKPEDFAI